MISYYSLWYGWFILIVADLYICSNKIINANECVKVIFPSDNVRSAYFNISWLNPSVSPMKKIKFLSTFEKISSDNCIEDKFLPFSSKKIKKDFWWYSVTIFVSSLVFIFFLFHFYNLLHDRRKCRLLWYPFIVIFFAVNNNFHLHVVVRRSTNFCTKQ